MKPTLETRLANGLKLIAIESRHNPVVTVDAWVDTGSRNEPAALNGVSHFLEHMLFKGTKKRGPNEIDLMIEEVGGDWNAGTSKDYTHYHCTVAAPFAELAMDVVSDILRNSVIDGEELEKERQVILEEWRRKQDSPGGVLWDEIYGAAYRQGPYRDTVLGSFESIKAIDRAGMVDYFQRYYAPANMALIVAGDIAASDALAMAERWFGDWKREHKPFANPTPDSIRNHGQSLVIEKDLKETYAGIAYPAPSAADEDDSIAFDILDNVLGGGDSSRLHQRLVEEERAVHGVGAGCAAHKTDGLFFVSGALDAANLDRFRALSAEEIEKVKQDGPTERELNRAKTVIFNEMAFSTETTSGQTSHVGYLHTLTGSTRFQETYVERMRAVTAEQVRAVAQRYLDPAATNEVILRPAAKAGATAHARPA